MARTNNRITYDCWARSGAKQVMNAVDKKEVNGELVVPYRLEVGIVNKLTETPTAFQLGSKSCSVIQNKV